MNYIKNNIAFIISLLILISCDSIFDNSDNQYTQNTPQPEWVIQILSSSVNINALTGEWSYSSVTMYDDSSCELNPKTFDIEGSIVYSDNSATRTLTLIYPYSEYQEDGYSLEMFQSDCVLKDGIMLTDTDCQIIDSYTLDYYLTADGYCEVYTKDDYTVTYCGSIELSDMYVDFTFTWDTEKENWSESVCKTYQINWVESIR